MARGGKCGKHSPIRNRAFWRVSKDSLFAKKSNGNTRNKGREKDKEGPLEEAVFALKGRCRQSCISFLLQKPVFAQLVMEALSSYNDDRSFAFSESAVQALREATKSYLVDCFFYKGFVDRTIFGI